VDQLSSRASAATSALLQHVWWWRRRFLDPSLCHGACAHHVPHSRQVPAHFRHATAAAATSRPRLRARRDSRQLQQQRRGSHLSGPCCWTTRRAAARSGRRALQHLGRRRRARLGRAAGTANACGASAAGAAATAARRARARGVPAQKPGPALRGAPHAQVRVGPRCYAAAASSSLGIGGRPEPRRQLSQPPCVGLAAGSGAAAPSSPCFAPSSYDAVDALDFMSMEKFQVRNSVARLGAVPYAACACKTARRGACPGPISGQRLMTPCLGVPPERRRSRFGSSGSPRSRPMRSSTNR
jgi:hypothetical protein